MTKQEFIQTIEAIIRKYGYEPYHYTINGHTDEFPTIHQEMDHYCAFGFYYAQDFNPETLRLTVKVRVQARICQMSGSPSEDDLWEAAAQINKGADLMHELNSMNLECDVTPY